MPYKENAYKKKHANYNYFIKIFIKFIFRNFCKKTKKLLNQKLQKLNQIENLIKIKSSFLYMCIEGSLQMHLFLL